MLAEVPLNIGTHGPYRPFTFTGAVHCELHEYGCQSLPAVLLFDDGMHVRNHVARFGSAPRNLVFVAVSEDADQLVVGEQFESFVRRIVHERDFR